MSKEQDRVAWKRRLHRRENDRLRREFGVRGSDYSKTYTPGYDFSPTRDFFNDEASQHIRMVCIAVISKIHNLVNFRIAPNTFRQLQAELEELQETLLALGIEPNMNLGIDVRDDPTKLAQWIASQLLPYTGRGRLSSSLNSERIAQEFAQESIRWNGVSIYPLFNKDVPDPLIDGIIIQWVLINSAHYLAVDLVEELEEIRS